MSKRAIIFHGTDCKPTDYWYAWLGEKLESRGFEVEIPSYPEINHEPIATFLPKVRGAHIFDEDTIIIGHSAGSALALSILEQVEAVLPQAVLVAGFSYPLSGEEADPILQDTYDWDKIKEHARDLVFINSVNDPWGCNDEQGRFMFERLGGTQVIRNDGHFGSSDAKQPFPTFELLSSLITD